jgi:exo-beta-1,3-glucanase (GH17 family)
MQTMYAQGAKGYFDAFAHHPYCYAADFDCPDTVADWSAWSQMNETSPSLRSIMAANGDSDKKIWLTEFGAPTGGGTKAVSEALQAKMVADAYAKVRTTSWLGPLLWYSLKDNGTNSTDMEDWFGVLRTDGSHKPAYDAYKTESAK